MKRAKRRGQPSAAVGAQPPEASALLAQAGRLHTAGDWTSAERLYREILQASPRHERALYLVGLLEYQRGAHVAARDYLQRVVELAGGVAIYRLWLGRVLRALGDTEAALREIRQARAIDPELAHAVQTEALVLRDAGQLMAAKTLLQDALARQPGNASMHASLGEVHLALEELVLARERFERAVQLDPTLLEAFINLGVTHQCAADFPAAIAALQRAIALQPTAAEAHYNLASAQQASGAFDAAITSCRRALELAPERGDWQVMLAGMLSEVSDFDEALALYRVGLARSPQPQAHSSLVALLQYAAPAGAAARVAEAEAWAATYAARTPTAPARPQRHGKLRVGYVSADFRQHSVSYFLEPLLQAHDHARIDVTCYSSSLQADEVTARLAQHARFVSIVGRSDAAVAEQIRADGIDVLVDLSGHTLGHRLSLFAEQAAPVQLAYLGYPGTTGVPAIRYRLTDALLDPAPIAAASYTEQLVRLPRVFCCFQPPANAPPVSPLPAAANGFVTFGSLNNYIKVSEPTLHAWSRVLAAVPDSQLVLQSRIFVDAASCERVRRRFAARGIAPERLHLHGPMPLEAHLRVYDSIDIGLDTLPWNGHTTTCLALHMGVPVVSLAGDVGAARMGLCVLSAADMTSWVATCEDGYVELARHHAARLDELAQLRAGLRERLASSPLCDAAGLARDVEAAYSALCDQNSSS